MGEFSGGLQKFKTTEGDLKGNDENLKALLQRGSQENCPEGGGKADSHGKLPTTGVPAHFDLKRYAVCRTWSLEKWTEALIVRRRLRLDWQDCSRPRRSSSGVYQNQLENLQFLSWQLLGDPTSDLGDYGRNAGIASLYRSGSPIADETVYKYFNSLSATEDPRYRIWLERYECAELNFHEYTSSDQCLVETNSLNDPAKSWPLVFITPSWKMHKEVGDFWGCHSVEVNLAASDELLINEFKAWIKKVRRERNEKILPKPIGQEKFDDWHRSKLLPYLDLTYWATVRDYRIPLRMIGEALYPVDTRPVGLDHGSEGHIRKTVATNAEWIISDTLIRTLKGQLIARRASTGKRKSTVPDKR